MSRFVAALAVLLLALTAGCSDSADGSDSAPDDRAEFTTQLMHRDAALLALLDTSLGKQLPTAVARAGEEARTAASSRIETAVDLLEEWGEEVPVTIRDHGTSHGIEADVPDLPDMATAAEIHAVTEASNFEPAFTDLLATTAHGTRDAAAAYDGSDDATADLADDAEASSEDLLAALD